MNISLPKHALRLLGLCLLFCAGLVAGCGPIDRPGQVPRGYFGKTDTLPEVITEINANNQRVPTLWARHYFEATIPNKKKDPEFVNGDGVLMYQSPQSLRLIGNKALAGRVFEIGSNAERFWLTILPELDTMWWGEYSQIDTFDPADVPIRPDQLLAVLGVGPIDTELLHEPAPVLRFNNDADAYMLVWNVRRTDRWVAQREVWYDRATKLPRSVLLFDADGRVTLRAFLSNHQPVETGQAGPKPRIATEYRLFFPLTGAKMSFELSDMKISRGGLPNQRSFAFPADPGVSHVIELHAKNDH